MTDVAALLAREWGLSIDEVVPLAGGMNSRTWRVRAGGSSYVAKQVPPSGLDDLVRGAEAARLMAAGGLASGPPLPAYDGSLVCAAAGLALLELVPGRELAGETDEEQGLIAETLATAHRIGAGPAARAFFAWLSPSAPGVAAHPWLAHAIASVRAEVDGLDLTWSLLHTDPAPEAFVHDDASGVTGLIDWAGATLGPVLYDVASAVMYLGGEAPAFVAAYDAAGVLRPDEWAHLAAWRRFRWAVQGAYFAGRIEAGDLTGIEGSGGNEAGLADARRGLAGLGLDVG